MAPEPLIDTLTGMEKVISKKVLAGPVAKKLYRLYEYKSVSIRA